MEIDLSSEELIVEGDKAENTIMDIFLLLSYLWTIRVFHPRKAHSIKINGQIIMNGT